ncbi:MAG: hypothetical protein GX753_04595, partial [Erysipelothrix sp.]|nr:hypothetical protein [Erysipelothrix sp.]
DILIDGLDPVGVSWIDNGVIWFEFDEDIEQGDVSQGFVEMELEFDLEKFDEQREHNIPFSEDENTSLTIIARPKSTNTGIAKEGHANATKDATFITWTVDVLNGTDEVLENASILDIIPDGLSLRPNSIKVYNLDTKLDGAKVQLDETANYKIEKTDTQFEITFDTMDPYKGYRVVYETTITDFTLETFSNTADLKYNDKTISATGSVTDISRSASIEKTGNYKNQNELSWTIDVNKSGLPISNATVTDLLPEGLSINPDSIQVYKITQQGNQWVKGADHPNLANIKATFATSKEIELGDLTAQDAYRIVFDTPVDWSEVNEGDYVRNNSFKNETTLKSGDTLVGVDDATVGIYRNTMIEKTGTNHVNYENKTVSWTVIVNKAQHPLGDIILTDTLPEGLSITESDIKIKNQNGQDITPTKVEITSQSDDKTKVDIYIANVGTDTLTIHYVTKIEDFTVNTFSNTAGVYGDGIGEPGEHTSGSVNPSGNSYTKVNNGRINYQDKTITWTIGVNPVRERITELKIEDYFDHKGMIALPDTFVVKKGNTTLQLGVDYTLAPRTDDGKTGYHKGFVINLIPNSNALPLDGAALTVEYKTSFDPQLEVDGNVLEPHIHAGNSNATREYINT